MGVHMLSLHPAIPHPAHAHASKGSPEEAWPHGCRVAFGHDES